MKPRSLVACGLLLAASLAPLPAQETPQAPPPQAPPQPQGEIPPPAATTPTLGEFALKVAGAMKLPAPSAGWTQESAAWALVGKGIILKGDLAAPLTEEAATAALVGMGYRVRTTTPSRVVSRDRLDVLVEVFLSEMK